MPLAEPCMGSRTGCYATNLHDMKKFLLTIIGLCALSPSAMAQDEAPKHLRFFPIGGLPIWKETLKKGVREGDPHLPGSVPPKVSMVSGGKVVPLDLMLKVFTPLQTLAPSTKGLTLKDGLAPESPNWLRQAKPTAPLSLGVLLPNAADKLWFKPRMLMLDDDASSFPAGKIRFVNVSDKVVYIRIGGERGRAFGVAPGKASKPRPVKIGSNSLKTIYRNGKGEDVTIWKNAIKVAANQRVQCFFCNTNAGKGKKSVEFHFLPEALPRLPKAPK